MTRKTEARMCHDVRKQSPSGGWIRGLTFAAGKTTPLLSLHNSKNDSKLTTLESFPFKILIEAKNVQIN